jgi:thiosulfate reductase cytochrome b subunit/cytochrome c553
MTKRNLFIAAGLLMIALAFGIGAAFAQKANAPAEAASPMHPTYALLDEDGAQVQTSNKPISTMQTCGQCHDAEYIVSHSYHADLGLSDYKETNDSWNASNGLFGKFDPITNRYLSQKDDSLLDLTTPDWLMTFGWRVPGGGPAVNSRSGQPLVSLKPNAKNPEASAYDAASDSYQAWDWKKSGVIEMNCFLCHTLNPNNDVRVEVISKGEFGWANTATLLGSGIVLRTTTEWVYNEKAFDANGELLADYVQLQEPTNANCASCHGEIHEDATTPLTLDACDATQTQTATTGQVVSSQKISESGINLADKADMPYAWDIHAERALKCTDCHYSLNNPAHSLDEKAANPEHLTYDPRKLEIGEYLEKPNHNFARGASAQFTVAPELKGTMRRCESCHDTEAAHAGWLPYNERHMQVVACESCHIPKMAAPAYASVDWTAIRLDGSAKTECRGIAGTNTTTDLVTGYQPVLMQRTNVDGNTLIAPYNLVTSFFWTYDDENGTTRPVRHADLEAAYLADGAYAADVLSAFDADADGQLSDAELVLDTDAKQGLISGKLETLGLKNVRIYGQVQPYSINHNVVEGSYATSECSTCHDSNSRVTEPLPLSDHAPLGVTPEFVSDTNVAFTGSIENRDGALVYLPANEKDNIYIFGHNRISWIDWFGALAFVGTIFGVGGHGTMRYLAARKHKKGHTETRRVYMYEAYERFWHWLQVVAIVMLLLTGLVIHRPDMFGAFSFRNIVIVHNVIAALLAINAALSLFWHLVSGEIRQYIPHPRGFIDDAITQALFYVKGIFKHETHPFEKTKERKLNPLQKVTYFGLLNVLLPLQGLTGILMWLVQKVPAIQTTLGGLPFLAPFHTLTAWLFAAFIVGHVYLTTTAGPKPLDGIQAMVTGWEDMEVHEYSEQRTESSEQ